MAKRWYAAICRPQAHSDKTTATALVSTATQSDEKLATALISTAYQSDETFSSSLATINGKPGSLYRRHEGNASAASSEQVDRQQYRMAAAACSLRRATARLSHLSPRGDLSRLRLNVPVSDGPILVVDLTLAHAPQTWYYIDTTISIAVDFAAVATADESSVAAILTCMRFDGALVLLGLGLLGFIFVAVCSEQDRSGQNKRSAIWSKHNRSYRNNWFELALLAHLVPRVADAQSTYFTVTSGSCTVDPSERNCIRSPNHPSGYVNNQMCYITPTALAIGRPLTATAFNTHSSSDYLRIPSHPSGLYTSFSGGGGPSNFILGDGTISWNVDSSGTSYGWRVCSLPWPPPPPPSPPSPPSPPPPSPSPSSPLQ